MRHYLVIEHRFVALMGVGRLPRSVNHVTTRRCLIGRAKRYMRRVR